MNMEKINMTVEKFFRSLPKLRKYKPVVTKSGRIRLGPKNKGYSMCPLTALRKELTGVAGDMSRADDYFEFSDNKNGAETLMCAADCDYFRDAMVYRQRMLKGLGLKCVS